MWRVAIRLPSSAALDETPGVVNLGALWVSVGESGESCYLPARLFVRSTRSSESPCPSG